MASAMPDSANSQRSRPARDEESDVLLPSLLHKGQLVVRNEGSVTRDYLAYERNYLAWVKLVVACIVISGGLIIRLHIHEDNTNPSRGETPLENKIAIPMGVIFFVVAVLALIAATMSFFQTQASLLKNVGFVTTGHITQAISLIATATIATACILLMISVG